MKALSLWQPWAWLVACGAKTCETRSWNTSHRGPIAIHAGQMSVRKIVRELQAKPDWVYFKQVAHEQCLKLSWDRFTFDDLPRGCILAVADLVNVTRIEPMNLPCSLRELAFGDYTPGRYCWHLHNVRPLAQPFFIRGCQRLWELPTWANARITRGGAP